MRIYYQVVNQHDGSYGVQFFDNPELIEMLQEHDPETYPAESEGSFDAYVFEESLRSLSEVEAEIAGEY